MQFKRPQYRLLLRCDAQFTDGVFNVKLRRRLTDAENGAALPSRLSAAALVQQFKLTLREFFGGRCVMRMD